MVSIAKAIPSLLELEVRDLTIRNFANVSIAKAIPSLLELQRAAKHAARTDVSIAKAIPSLLERLAANRTSAASRRFNRESDSVTVGADGQFVVAGSTAMFQSRKRFRHCWSENGGVLASVGFGGFNRESDSVTVGAQTVRAFTPKGATCFNRESDSVTVGAPANAVMC